MSTWKNYQNAICGCESWDESHPDYLRISERFASISEFFLGGLRNTEFRDLGIEGFRD
jgi:hypothetical protein